VSPDIDRIFFFINNVGEEDFSLIPFAKIRMYEGTPERVDKVHAEFDVVSNPSYQGKKAMIMGKLYRRGSQWKFAAIGDATDDGHFAASIVNIFKNYA
jgi:tellurium resistance protein TerZ